jgi:hypothetical protein
MALFDTSCLGQRPVRDGCLKVNMCVSKSDATQKVEPQQADGNEQRLHRSFGRSILAKSTRSRFIPDRQQPRISRSPWSGTRGRRNSIADVSEVRYTENRYRSVQPRKILGQLYPTRQKGVRSKLLSLNGASLTL